MTAEPARQPDQLADAMHELWERSGRLHAIIEAELAAREQQLQEMVPRDFSVSQQNTIVDLKWQLTRLREACEQDGHRADPRPACPICRVLAAADDQQE